MGGEGMQKTRRLILQGWGRNERDQGYLKKKWEGLEGVRE